MSSHIKWESQSLIDWTNEHAEGKVVVLDGHQTHYLEFGEDNNDPIILLHGFFYDSFMWASNVEELAKKHKVYVPDLWGFGYSTRNLMDYSYELYVNQILLFMNELGIEKSSFAGQSLGGGIIIKLTVDHPEKVNKIILIDAAGMPNKQPLMAKIINTFPSLGYFMYGMDTDNVRKKGLLDYFVHDKKLLTDEYFSKVTRFHKIKGTIAVMLDIMRRDFFFTLHDEIRQLAKLGKEVLIVWGQHDKGNPVHLGQAMHDILVGSEFKIIDDAKHVPNSEKPELFNKIAINFLR